MIHKTFEEETILNKKMISIMLLMVFAISLLAACSKSGNTASTSTPTVSNSASTASAAPAGPRQKVTMWFWGASPESQQAMKDVLIDPYNNSQDKYELVVEFRNTVDKDISVALSANQGPDIVYGSGPSFVIPLAAAGKLESLDKYSQKYGWKDRLLDPIYQSATVNGTLYSLPNSLNTLGVFYNKALLKENGWAVPKTVQELENIMDQAIKKGLYASVTGNKGWQPVNENYASLFLTHFAGAQNVYKALNGEQPWDSPAIVAAVEKSAEWFKKGYLGGKDYTNLNFNDAAQLLADKKSPFFIGPTLVYQFAAQFFKDDKANDLGFIPFPAVDANQAYPIYTLGTTASLSINANSKNKDAAAEILDKMMTSKFLVDMTKKWPGYWGVPLKSIDVDTSDMTGLSADYINVIKDMMKAVNAGNFGYFSGTFFPPATQNEFINIDTVWQGTATADEMLKKADAEFAKEKAKGLVPPIPQPK
jgi:raffinose/stachyose/melibiose transport system substrate-binding protein